MYLHTKIQSFCYLETEIKVGLKMSYSKSWNYSITRPDRQITVMYETRNTAFDHISEHREGS